MVFVNFFHHFQCIIFQRSVPRGSSQLFLSVLVLQVHSGPPDHQAGVTLWFSSLQCSRSSAHRPGRWHGANWHVPTTNCCSGTFLNNMLPYWDCVQAAPWQRTQRPHFGHFSWGTWKSLLTVFQQFGLLPLCDHLQQATTTAEQELVE